MKISRILIVILGLLLQNQCYADIPRLLIKIPTRSRPEQFFRYLDLYYKNLSGEIPYHFLVSCDVDDLTMNNESIINRFKTYPHLSFSFKPNRSKVEAYNADIDDYIDDFDILLVTSDDMEPVYKNYDKLIVSYMQETFPDFDGVLNFHDGNLGAVLNTYPVIGKTFYKRFGYAYSPSYTAFFCDEELTLVSRILCKERICNEIVLRHQFPGLNSPRWDALYQRNDQFMQQDRAIFAQRRDRFFDLDPTWLDQAMPKTWSILMCTLEGRKHLFERIFKKLTQQINDAGLQDQIEVVSFCDNRHYSIGFKRNALLQKSKGKYTCFVDDDDDVSDRYIISIYEQLKKDPDCISLEGIRTVDGRNPRKFIHSLKYDACFEKDGIYYRPPNHLSPMKRSIAVQFLFPEKNSEEDRDWALAIARSGLLKREIEMQDPYYFYLYISNRNY